VPPGQKSKSFLKNKPQSTVKMRKRKMVKTMKTVKRIQRMNDCNESPDDGKVIEGDVKGRNRIKTGG
jgi:hypothetical protein